MLEKKLYSVIVVALAALNANGQPEMKDNKPVLTIKQHNKPPKGFEEVFPKGSDFIQTQLMMDEDLYRTNAAGKRIFTGGEQSKAVTWNVFDSRYPFVYNAIQGEFEKGNYEDIGEYKSPDGKKTGRLLKLTEYMEWGRIYRFATNEHYQLTWSETENKFVPTMQTKRNINVATLGGNAVTKEPMILLEEKVYLHGEEADTEDIAKANVLKRLDAIGAFKLPGSLHEAIEANVQTEEVNNTTKTAEKP